MRKEAFGADVTPEIIESTGFYPVSMISSMIHPVIWPGWKTKPRLPNRRTAIGQAYCRRSAGLVAAGDRRRESRDCWPAGTPRLRESPNEGIILYRSDEQVSSFHLLQGLNLLSQFNPVAKFRVWDERRPVRSGPRENLPVVSQGHALLTADGLVRGSRAPLFVFPRRGAGKESYLPGHNCFGSSAV